MMSRTSLRGAPDASAARTVAVRTVPGVPSAGRGESGWRRRRELPYLMRGMGLVVVGALAVVLMVMHLGGRVTVLVVARDVPAGQLLSAADVRSTSLFDGSGLAMVPADQIESVLGRPAVVPLHAGRLLAPDDVGPLAWPPAGQTVVAIAVKPGAYPPDLAPGMRVLIAIAPAPAANPGAEGTAGLPGPVDALAGAPSGVVLAARRDDADQGQEVVSLLLTRSAAGQVVALPADQVHLVLIPPPASPASAATSPALGGG
jgi:SAF domain